MDYASALRQGLPGTPSGPGPQYIPGLGTFRPGETWDSDLKRRLLAAGGGLADTLTFGMGTPEGAQGAMAEQPEAASSGSMLGAMLPVGEGVVAAGNAIKAAPKMSAALMGALGLGLNPADAGPKLTKAQQRALEMEKQRAGMSAESDKARAMNEIEVENMRRQANDKLDAEAKAKEANTPFRERFPEIAGKLPTMGLMLSAGLPFALRGSKNAMSFLPGSLPSRVAGATKAAEKAASEGNVMATTLKAKELDNLIQSAPGVGSNMGKAGAAAAAGGALTAEANMFPDQYDAFNLPAGEAQDKARERALNPMNYGERALVGTLTGLSGYKAGDLIPSRTANIPRAQSMADLLKPGLADDVRNVSNNLNALNAGADAPIPHWQRQTRVNGKFGPLKK
jgi:hypothetical protein